MGLRCASMQSQMRAVRGIGAARHDSANESFNATALDW
ncbi:hypothetical protein FHY31_002647 [Xanthomonas euvesicatoria]|uniref:Uncharacterized protein n=1 Tax=Xanthomonas euvesicatoria TaxID=456327 RepID=A0AAW3U5V2_XANEU|nr:hypothetical protein [Xanthomonas euvesicatoria]MBB4870877.1 hypothetical protein [Xanthomonas euvesicatoria]